MVVIKKSLLAVVFGLLVLAVLATTLATASYVNTAESGFALLGRPPRLAQETERFFTENLSVTRPLRDLQQLLRTLVGQREFGNVYLTDDGLVTRFIPTEDTTLYRRNTERLLQFAKDSDLPTAVVLLPTASAIYQDKLPPYAAEIQFGQHSFIEGTYKNLSETLATVDVYPALFAARDSYLYYRTDNRLTTQGGYIVYQSLARRLGLTPIAESAFRLQTLADPYYGELYRSFDSGGVKGDTVTLYHPPTAPLVSVRHWQRFQQKTYHTLYPIEAKTGGDPTAVLLGGRSPRIQITNYLLPAAQGSLLVLGDLNTLSYLPFLALHYRTITFADPDLLTDSELAGINPTDYNQVLFSFSLERYMNSSQPTRAASAGTPAPK